MRTQFVTMLAAAALIAVAPAVAQDTNASSNRKGSAERMKSESATTVSAADRSFATKTAQDGMAEVQLGNLAKDHASNAAVKDFGNRMVTDHTKANDQLKDWASKNNVTLPTDMDAKDKAEYDRLSKLNGDAFDKAYMRTMVSDHTKDVAAFKKESDRAHNADLKKWVADTTPTLEDHLKQAKDVAAQVGATGHARHESAMSEKPEGAAKK